MQAKKIRFTVKRSSKANFDSGNRISQAIVLGLCISGTAFVKLTKKCNLIR